MRKATFPVIVLVIAACGEGDPAQPKVDAPPITVASDAGARVDARAVPDAPADAGAGDAPPVVAECTQYPVPWVPAPATAHAAAAAELATIAPGALLSWDDHVNTLNRVVGLDARLPGCVDGADANEQVRALIAAHPALFQIDVSEWDPAPRLDCSRVTEAAQGIVVRRPRIAGHSEYALQDVFTYFLVRAGGAVEISEVRGYYLPQARGGVGDTMAACNRLTQQAAEATARATSLSAAVLDGCQTVRTLTYRVQANDSVVLDPSDAWYWIQDYYLDGTEALLGVRTLRVTVNPLNYTADLLASNARCPVPGGSDDQFTIAFDFFYDAFGDGVANPGLPNLDCFPCDLPK
jgi:hypothetical protein